MQDDINNLPGISALFDLSFTRFITISVVKVIYVLGIALLGLLYLIAVLHALFSSGFFAGLVTLVVGLLVLIVYLLMMRVYLELIVVIFRIGENTTAMRNALAGQPPTGGFPVSPLPSQPLA